jgi:hypothetical protein
MIVELQAGHKGEIGNFEGLGGHGLELDFEGTIGGELHPAPNSSAAFHASKQWPSNLAWLSMKGWQCVVNMFKRSSLVSKGVARSKSASQVRCVHSEKH